MVKYESDALVVGRRDLKTWTDGLLDLGLITTHRDATYLSSQLLSRVYLYLFRLSISHLLGFSRVL